MKGSVEISIAKNMMSASAFFEMDGEEEITEEYILQCMEEQGIKAGIKKDVIQTILLEVPYGKEYVVAEGKPAKQGEAGYYEFFFETEKKSIILKY